MPYDTGQGMGWYNGSIPASTTGGFNLSGLGQGLGASFMGGGSGYGQILQALSGIGQAVSTGVYDEAYSDFARSMMNDLLNAERQVRGYAGDLNFPEVNLDPMSFYWAFGNPNANPALSALTMGALQGYGLPASGVLEEGGPQARLVNQLGAMGLTHTQYNKQLKKLQSGQSSKILNKAATQAGYTGGYGGYQSAQKEWQAAAQKANAAYEAIRPQVESGRMSALEAIARIQQDFPAPTETDIRSLEQRVIDQRTNEINRETALAREAALQQANVGGYNPARTVGDIEQRRLDQIYNVQQSDALERAIALLSGSQGLSTSALASLTGSLAAPSQQAQAAAGLYSQGSQVMADVALRQALATNETMANAAFFNASQQTAEQLARTNLLMQALGLKLQGQATGRTGEYQKQTSFARGIDKFTSMYGGGGGGGGGLSFV